MATFVFLDGIDGVWATSDVPTYTQWSLLDAQLFAALDGDNGGSWAPTSAIEITNLHVPAPPEYVDPLPFSAFIRILGFNESINTDAYWAWGGGNILGLRARTALSTGTPIDIPLTRQARHGATITNVRVYYAISTSHASGLPETMPNLAIYRRPADGSGEAELLHEVDAGLLPTPESAEAYYLSGYTQHFDLACDQKNVIDATAYVYFARWRDESGSNAFAENSGNYLLAMRLDYTVPSMAFP